jgi:ligand-binding sensor domain-containing protein
MRIEKVLDSRSGLPAEGISRLSLDPSGRLWVGTEKGIYCQEGDSSWTVYGEAQGVRPGWVDDLQVNPGDGHVWAIVRGKLHHLDGGSWRVYFPDNWHGNLFLDGRGRTCASAWQNGVRCYEAGRWLSFRQHEEGNDFVNWTETGQADREGNLWVGTWGFGAWRYDGSSWAQYTVRQGLGDNHVNRLAAAPNGDLWAAFPAPGISRLHRGRWRSFYEDGAPRLEIEALLVARDGSVWAATGGLFPALSRFDGRHWAAATIDGRIFDMVEDREGRIWLATGNAVVVARLE